MKLSVISESEKGSLVAHVGASLDTRNPENKIWSDADDRHIIDVFQWLERYGFGDMMVDRKDDFIDLNDGRDFLHENQKYDIVILHSVFNPLDHDRRRYASSPGIFHVSPSHDRLNWVHRLADTEAHYIFAFGGSGNEVDGEFLKEIPGYDGPIEVDSYLDVYMRLW